MELDVADLSTRACYKLLIGGIVPRPIALVSTVSPNGTPNLAPFSFFAGVGSNPMTLLFCPANDAEGGEKDTLRNALPVEEGGTGEFVVNVAIEQYASRVAAAAEPVGPEVDEFQIAGLPPLASRSVEPPRVAESPIAYECKTRHVLRLNPGEPGGGNIVVGEVVHVFVRDSILTDRLHIDPQKLCAVGRMGGLSYCTTRDRFEMPMGIAALDG